MSNLILSKKVLVILLIVLTCAFAPLLQPMPGSGLVSAEAVGPFMNGAFPSTAPFGNVGLEVAYPNLTFNSGLTWTMHPNADTIFVGQRDGLVQWFSNEENTTNKSTMLDLRSEVGVVWDGGFLGLALHPDFGKAGEPGRNSLFVYFCTRDGSGGNSPQCCLPQPCISGAQWNGGYNILRRYEVFDGTLNVDPNSGVDMFKVRHYGSTHYGGGMLFGDDGFLYLSTGDQAQHNVAQDIWTNLDGATLRLDVDMDPAKSHAPIYTHPQDSRGPDEISGQGYWIPNDNPWVGQNVFEEYWSMGHRNPHRMTKDSQTGELWNSEIGAATHEEVNYIEKGNNYGWPVYEGYVEKNTCVSSLYGGMSHTGPVTAFPRSEANSIIGGFVYRGAQIPQLYGKYLCADYGSGKEVWAVDTETGQYELLLNFTQGGSIITFGQDHDGELYVMAQGSNLNIYRFVPQNANAGLPTTLSQTGLFSNLSTLTPAQGVIPYELIESFWSDGAVKRRWLSVPNDGTHNTASEQVLYSENGIWEFPVGSVVVKHFELPLNSNDLTITKRLETRVVVIHEPGKAYWMTYKWRADGSDADLLSSGLDEQIIVNTTNGPETRTWHYPGRAECFACHNDNSKGTLGLRSRNLNKEITYPSTGLTGNQLVSLSAIGLLNQTISDSDTEAILTHAAKNDFTQSLSDRARSYLDLNCAYCHEPGTGNRAVFDARLSTSFAAQDYLSAELNESLGIPGEAIVVPYDTAASILYQRLHALGPYKMPLIAKNLVDEEGSELIADWIMDLDATANCSSEFFDAATVLQYAGNQDQGTASVLDNGSTIKVQDNAWKAVQKQYNVTPDTKLVFEFKSSAEGEEHSIGLSTSLSITNLRFQVYGTQNSTTQAFNTYSGNGQYEEFVIPIGQFTTGQFEYLFMICDKDAAPVQSESYFRNVRIFEDADGNNLCDGETMLSLSPKVFLQGPYNNGAMLNSLSLQGLLPIAEPYSATMNLINSGGERMTDSDFALAAQNGVVDWVLIELRDAQNNSTIVASKPAVLYKDGTVRSAKGGAVKMNASPGDYFVAVRHRNHLGVVTLNTISLSEESTTVDFTDPSLQLYGSEATQIVGGARLLWSGDANADAKLRYTGSNNDRDLLLNAIGGSVPTAIQNGYLPEDLNLDGVVKYMGANNDRDALLLNLGGSVVTTIRSEQLP